MIKYLYKDAFAVIGKMGQGAAGNTQEWIPPLWEAANSNFKEVENLIRKSKSGAPLIWGAMNDINESNKRWGETGMATMGKYMAGGEADARTVPPDGWSKWVIPAQTYLVASCSMDDYGKVFMEITEKLGAGIVGSIHEFYPEPGNPNMLDIYFPIATGMMFCQSCGMPMPKPNGFGKNASGSASFDYCQYCYPNGAFTNDDETMEEMIESCIPHCRDRYASDDAARADMMEKFPKMKRWAK